jgi:hypothetical protein
MQYADCSWKNESPFCEDPESLVRYYHPTYLLNGWGHYKKLLETKKKGFVDVFVLWNGGADVYQVDPATVRELTEEEQSNWFEGNSRYFPTVDEIWLKGSFLQSSQNQEKIKLSVCQCVRIVAHISSSD